MAYKHVIKVNDVCQLLDKDNLNSFVVGNLDKITVTDNKDGTFILNGTYSNTYASWYILMEWDIEKGNISQIVEGHKYLLLGDPENVSKIHVGINIWYADGSRQSNYAGIITTIKTTKLNTVRVEFSFYEGATADNAISKPQIFDLTEMYGAGNEPTTVEQFRADFPNELYPYSPLVNLSSIKRMIKVSNVCQLVPISDKADGVANGVTFTNNHNGSWTISGTSSKTCWYALFSNIPLKSRHIYLNAFTRVGQGDDYVETKWKDKDGTIHWGENPYTADENSKCDVTLIRIGEVTNTVTLYPQLFDLTEMYGAGHEPATVAEFRQKFPDELYPYSPQCWLTSYQSAVICKTKNLFDVNNAAPYNFVTDNYDSNLVWLKDGVYTTRMNNYNLGSGLRIKNGWSLPAGAYTVSVRIVDFNNIENFVIGFRYKTTDGTWKVSNYFYWSANYKVGDTIALAVTLPENTDVRLYMGYQNDNGQYLTGYVSYKDIQVEKGGSTATSYVPYQHL